MPKCLAPLRDFEEIIVYDSGSTDKTVEVAQKFGATVIEGSWEGFGSTRKKLFEAATGETVQKWSYPKIGVTLDMAQSEQAETLRVYRIQAEKPCQWIGWDGIGIGSPAAKAKAYVSGLQMNPKNEVSISSDSCSVLLTDSWTMLVFTLTEDKVSQIFFGPGPE